MDWLGRSHVTKEILPMGRRAFSRTLNHLLLNFSNCQLQKPVGMASWRRLCCSLFQNMYVCVCVCIDIRKVGICVCVCVGRTLSFFLDEKGKKGKMFSSSSNEILFQELFIRASVQPSISPFKGNCKTDWLTHWGRR